MFFDSNEPDSLKKRMSKHGWIPKKLVAGDYETETCIVERKTFTDLFSSIFEHDGEVRNRYKYQIAKLSLVKEKKVVFLIEGSIGLAFNYPIKSYELLYKGIKSEVDPNRVKIWEGFQASLIAKYGFHLMLSLSESQSEKLLLNLASKSPEYSSYDWVNEMKVPLERVSVNQFIDVVSYVSSKTGREWKKMKKDEIISTLNSEKKIPIDGIGPKTIEKIVQYIGENYQ